MHDMSNSLQGLPRRPSLPELNGYAGEPKGKARQLNMRTLCRSHAECCPLCACHSTACHLLREALACVSRRHHTMHPRQ